MHFFKNMQPVGSCILNHKVIFTQATKQHNLTGSVGAGGENHFPIKTKRSKLLRAVQFVNKIISLHPIE